MDEQPRSRAVSLKVLPDETPALPADRHEPDSDPFAEVEV
jgi:hypothetical protein